MRYLVGLFFVCALGMMPLLGCGDEETADGTGGVGGVGGDGGEGGSAGCATCNQWLNGEVKKENTTFCGLEADSAFFLMECAELWIWSPGDICEGCGRLDGPDGFFKQSCIPCLETICPEDLCRCREGWDTDKCNSIGALSGALRRGRL